MRRSPASTAESTGGVDSIPDEITLPPVRRPREAQQDPYFREIEIDPRKYLPDDVYRDPVTALPDEITIDTRPLKDRLRQREQR